MEAYIQSLRQELYMTSSGIEACVINPGFVETKFGPKGDTILANYYNECEKISGNSNAKEEYKTMTDHFSKYCHDSPKVHVMETVHACEHALLSKVPRSSYKVGVDSKVSTHCWYVTNRYP